MKLKQEIINLYRKTATELPEDITRALEKASRNEDSPVAKELLEKILENVYKAKAASKPICQDTGIPIFYIKHPSSYSQEQLRQIVDEATIIATKEIPLRPNAVDTLLDENIGNKAIIHFEESEKLGIDLIMKGGGSENVSGIYQLPNQELNADRNLDGIRRCVLDSIYKAQGKGCPPYVIGVAAAGSIEEVAHLAKKQLLRKMYDKNPIPELNALEKQALDEINQLNIGPLGLGGKSTALGVKIITAPRHPASYFVGVSIGCWCLRRQSYD